MVVLSIHDIIYIMVNTDNGSSDWKYGVLMAVMALVSSAHTNRHA
jgi:hypothetical protein